MSHFFGVGGNPFGSPVGQLIEKATDGSQASENWALFLETCDLINDTEDGPKDGMKAIKKRLGHNAGKNYQVVLYTLTLLETCVKNCGRRFHNLIAQKDFLQDLIKIIGPKNDPPQVVQEKILSLIQTWADAFQGIPELKEVGKVYQDLKHKGIEFPPTDLDHMAPIHTPARSGPGMDPPAPVPQRQPSARVPAVQVARSPQRAHTLPYPTQGQPPAPAPAPAPAPTGPVMLGPEQLAKLRSELDIVQQNIKVLSEMLTELTPGQENPSDLELLQDLNRTCRQMQHRIVDLIERVQNEEVTGELLRMNDELNNVFLRYERFERLRSNQLGTAASPPQTAAGTAGAAATHQGPPPALQPPPGRASSHAPPPYPGAAEPTPATANLIDLGDTSPTPPVTGDASHSDISVQLAGINLGANSVSGTLSSLDTTTATVGGATVGGPAQDDEFDMFAQSRQSFEQNKQAPASAAYVNQPVDQFSGGLGAAVTAKSGGNAQPVEENLDNEKRLIDKESDYEEMEKWLRQNPAQAQAQAGQPSADSATSVEFDRFLQERATEDGTAPSPQQQARGGRQMQKDDTENALFAL